MRRGLDDAELDRVNLGKALNANDRIYHEPSAQISIDEKEKLVKFVLIRGYSVVVLVGLAVLASVLLPANLLATQRFHHDEALYATWALHIVSGHDPWLTHTPVDKPPLFLYLLAGSMNLLGVTETAARIPSLLATAGTVLLTFALGRRWYGAGVGLTAAWLVALSPFTLLFAPTAFTDPLLALWILAACLAASYGRAGWAGVGLGLAIATKQQGVFFAPLVIGILVISNWLLVIGKKSKHQLANSKSRNFFNLQLPITNNFLLALLLTLLPLLIWDFSRSQTTDVFTRSLDNYGGLTIEWASLGERWQGFLDLLWYATASLLLNTIFVVGLPLLLGYGWWQATADPSTWLRTSRRPETGDNSPPCSPTPLLHSPVLTDTLFTLFTLSFILAHALLSFQVWDRYLLGLIPFLALLLARILWLPWSVLSRVIELLQKNLDTDKHRFHGLSQKIFRNLCSSLKSVSTNNVDFVYSLALAVLLAMTLARPAQDAVNGRYPLGSHSQALAGIEQVVAYLQSHAGANHTLFHRWLGTHWRFYLWGYPYDLQYWASPQELAAKAKPGYLIAFPSWQSETEARLALVEIGLELKELARGYNSAGYPSIVLYEITKNEQ
ncbi:MAG: glycosyltransferase family 39 protein [Anaerolineae bacterium]